MSRIAQNGAAYLHQELTEQVIGAALDVHTALGPGLLKSAYESCLAHEFTLRGIEFVRQVELPVQYKDHLVECGYRIDLLVADRVIVELESVDRLLPIHEAQLLTYLKLSGIRIGLLINFNVKHLRDGIKRRIV